MKRTLSILTIFLAFSMPASLLMAADGCRVEVKKIGRLWPLIRLPLTSPLFARFMPADQAILLKINAHKSRLTLRDREGTPRTYEITQHSTEDRNTFTTVKEVSSGIGFWNTLGLLKKFPMNYGGQRVQLSPEGRASILNSIENAIRNNGNADDFPNIEDEIDARAVKKGRVLHQPVVTPLARVGALGFLALLYPWQALGPNFRYKSPALDRELGISAKVITNATDVRVSSYSSKEEALHQIAVRMLSRIEADGDLTKDPSLGLMRAGSGVFENPLTDPRVSLLLATPPFPPTFRDISKFERRMADLKAFLSSPQRRQAFANELAQTPVTGPATTKDVMTDYRIPNSLLAKHVFPSDKKLLNDHRSQTPVFYALYALGLRDERVMFYGHPEDPRNQIVRTLLEADSQLRTREGTILRESETALNYTPYERELKYRMVPYSYETILLEGVGFSGSYLQYTYTEDKIRKILATMPADVDASETLNNLEHRKTLQAETLSELYKLYTRSSKPSQVELETVELLGKFKLARFRSDLLKVLPDLKNTSGERRETYVLAAARFHDPKLDPFVIDAIAEGQIKFNLTENDWLLDHSVERQSRVFEAIVQKYLYEPNANKRERLVAALVDIRTLHLAQVQSGTGSRLNDWPKTRNALEWDHPLSPFHKASILKRDDRSEAEELNLAVLSLFYAPEDRLPRILESIRKKAPLVFDRLQAHKPAIRRRSSQLLYKLSDLEESIQIFRILLPIALQVDYDVRGHGIGELMNIDDARKFESFMKEMINLARKRGSSDQKK